MARLLHRPARRQRDVGDHSTSGQRRARRRLKGRRSRPSRCCEACSAEGLVTVEMVHFQPIPLASFDATNSRDNMCLSHPAVSTIIVENIEIQSIELTV